MLVMHLDEGWHLHQPASLRQGGSTNVGCGRFNGKLSRAVPALVAKEGYMTAPIPIPDLRLITRRSVFVGAAASLLCAPAIVRATNLMPVRRLPFPFGPQTAGFVERLRFQFLEGALRSGWDDKRHGPVVGGISEAQARRTVAYAQAHGFLPPHICIYRND